MKNRIVNLLLVCALVVGLILPAAQVSATETTEATETTAVTETTAPAEPGRMVASEACIDMIKGYEGFSQKPYWDYAQWTVGYGTRCPSDKLEYYKANGITQEEAETLLRNYIGGVERYIYTHLIDKHNLEMSQQQFDALISFSYNVGSAWMVDSDSSFRTMVISGNTDPNTVIDRFARWCNAGGSVLTALIRRRLCEANMYLYGEYVQTPPSNICYVRYNGNGGTVSDKIQGYHADLTATPAGTASHSGYTFEGWYTMAVGGTQVTVLDPSVSGMTLYARWSSNGESGVEQPADPVTVNVTGNAVNLRQGPGTNFSIVGRANKGDKLAITEVSAGGSLVWGMSEKGWICLDYTDYYDQVNDSEETTPEETTPEETTPEETTPEETKPEETKPEETKPEETKPEETKPEETEPEETEPEATEPQKPATVTGVVKANGGLRVRTGPGTGYGVVTTLANGSKVEILEQKTAGAMTWGRVTKGWISMDYVVLDQQTQTPGETEPPVTTPPETDQPTAQSVKGTVKASPTLRVRKTPSTSAAIAGYLANGTKVEILEQQTVGATTWGRVSKGWISMDYVVLDQVTQTPEETEPPVTTQPEENDKPTQDETPAGKEMKGTVNVRDVLRVRNTAATGAVVGYYSAGAQVTILETTSVGSTLWGRTDRGWISMDYVRLETSGQQTESKTVTADCLRVRSAAVTGSVVAYYYRGTKVQIIETTTVEGALWGRTDKGWISMDYVK